MLLLLGALLTLGPFLPDFDSHGRKDGHVADLFDVPVIGFDRERMGGPRCRVVLWMDAGRCRGTEPHGPGLKEVED